MKHAIFGERELRFSVVDATPYFGYEVVFTGTAAKCLDWCARNNRKAVEELLTAYTINDELITMVMSHLLLNSMSESLKYRKGQKDETPKDNGHIS